MQTKLQRRRYRVLLGSAAAFPLVLAIVSAVLLHRIDAELDQSIAAVAESRAILGQTDTVLRLATDAETSQRGYVATGHADFLQPYREAVEALPTALRQLRAVAGTDPTVQALTRRLETEATAKLAHVQASVTLAQSQGREAAAELMASKRGLRLMDQVRSVHNELSTYEQQKLTRRGNALQTSIGRERKVAVGLIVALVALCALIGGLILEVARARALARVCAWSRTVEFEGDWISFEEYLKRRFGIDTTHGISPKEAAKHAERLRQAQAERAARSE